MCQTYDLGGKGGLHLHYDWDRGLSLRPCLRIFENFPALKEETFEKKIATNRNDIMRVKMYCNDEIATIKQIRLNRCIYKDRSTKNALSLNKLIFTI